MGYHMLTCYIQKKLRAVKIVRNAHRLLFTHLDKYRLVLVSTSISFGENFLAAQDAM